MRKLSILIVLAVLSALAFAAVALAHSERMSFFPDYKLGKVPEYRKSGKALVVCKKDSKSRIAKLKGTKTRKRNQALLKKCRFDDIQDAVDVARSGARIMVLPGVYREEDSLKVPFPDPKCEDPKYFGGGSPAEGSPPTYEYQVDCPKSANMISILGDGPDADRLCDLRCNIQIEGTGRKPSDVLIEGSKSKLNVVRADRADGVVLRNFGVQHSDFNNIYVLETNGFRIEKIVSRYSREYGVLSFTSDNGLYSDIEAYGNGDSGIYPGSGPDAHCSRYGIEIRRVNSHHNTIGYSGTAGNGVWLHDSKLHHNSTGLTTDSFASNHPGMPQDCAKWENNEIYSNNADLFNAERDKYCKETPYKERDDEKVCPTFQVPVGTGALIAGGNGNIIRNNRIWDNWRNGTRLFFVPTYLRGEDPSGQSQNDQSNQFDTSHKNTYEGNIMGVDASGKRDPNGVDFWWDEQGSLNCWTKNKGVGDAKPTSDPASVPDCPGSAISTPPNPLKDGFQVPCATWNPTDNTDPPGCDWFTVPPEPQ